MPPQRDPISVRTTRLNNLLIGRGCGVVQKAPSSRRSILPPPTSTTNAVAEAICREALLDAVCLLYNECDKDALKKRDRHIAEFVNKYRPIIEETQQLRVNNDDFVVKTLIGKGYFGNVHLVVERLTGDIYAMKKIKKSVMTTSQVKEERDIMARRCSEWITNLQYAFQDNDNLYLIMEFLPGGDLLSLMSRHGPFDEDLARFYLAELTQALHSLHCMGYVHRDIKPENILIDRFGHIKLADFGNAASLDRDGHVLSLSPVGTPDYIAPELLQTISTFKLSKSMHDVSCDFWSMGIIGYELICEITPFHEENVHETYSKILSHCNESRLKEIISFPSDLKVSANYKNLIESLVTNHTNRLGYEQIRNHPYFETVKWSTLRAQVPPIIPSVKSDDDTSNFDDNTRHKVRQHNSPKKSLTSNMKSNDFSGKNLPFIGYSFVHMAKQQQQSLAEDTIQTDDVRMCKLNEKLKELQHKLKERMLEINKLKQDLLRAEQMAQISDTKSKVLNEAKEEIKKLQNIIKEKTIELSTCKTQIKTLMNSVKIEEEMWEKKEATITDLLRLNRQKYEEAKIASEQRYEKQLAEKKNELANIVQKLDAREAEFNAKVEDCKHLADKMENYKELLRQCKEQAQVDKENFEKNKLQITESYEQKFMEMRSKLRKEKDSSTRLTFELQDIRTELDESKHSTRSTQEAKQATEKNNEEILKRLNCEIEANNKLHVENSTLEQKLTETQRIVQDLNQEVARLERELELVECSKNLAESALASPYETAPGSLTDLNAIEDQLRADLEAAKENETVQKTRADKLQELVVKLEEMLERFNEQSLSPTKPCPAPRHLAAGDILERQNEKLEDKLAAVREQMIVERQAARTANLSLWKVEKQLEETLGEKKVLQRRMELTEDRIKKVQSEREEAQRILKSAQDETRQREERIEELKKELASSKHDVLKEHRMWEKSEQERMKCKSELLEHIANVQKLEERLAEQRQKLLQTQQRCDALSLEHKRLMRELNEEREHNSNVTDNASAIQIELKNLKDNYERLKYACTVTDNQLTEVEAMLEAEQKRNTTQQEKMDKLYATLRDKDEKMSQLKKELHEEQSGRKVAEKRVDVLKNEVEEVNLNLQDVQKKLIAQQQQLVENTNDLYSTQERVEMLSNDTMNLKTLNDDYVREIHDLKEENSRILSELFRSKEEVNNLQQEIKEKLANIDDLNAEIDELQETVTEKENYYVQRDIKSEATLAQHKKLIDYLQLKVEDLSKNKKKTLANKLFGTSSSTKENFSPNDIETSMMYRTLKEELRREKQLTKSLQEQLEQANGTVTLRSPLKSRSNKSDDAPQRPVTIAGTNALMRSPQKQSTVKRTTSQVIESKKNSASPSKMQQALLQTHHRFELALQETKTDAADCTACKQPIIAGSPYWKCKECKLAAHRKCRGDVKDECEGIGGILAKASAPSIDDMSAADSCDDAQSLDKYSYKAIDTVDTTHSNNESNGVNGSSNCASSSAMSSSEYVGNLIFKATKSNDMVEALEIDCAYEIVEQEILLLGSSVGLFAYHVRSQNLVQIIGIDSVSYIAISERLSKAIMVGTQGEKLHQCDFRQLQTRCLNVTGCQKPALESCVIDLPFANRTASEKWKMVEISNETENALDSVAIAATSTRIVILKYDLKLHKFKPVRALDTATPVISIFYTRHSAIVSSDKFYEIDLDNYAAEEFVDFADKSLAHIATCQPFVAVRISNQEFLLCFAECGIFVDEYGCRSRPYELNWKYAPTGFMYREPFLYISHFQSVQIMRLHRSYTKELKANEKVLEDDDATPDFQRIYLQQYMPTLLANSGEMNLYMLAIEQHNTQQQIYHIDALQAFKQKLNISIETISSVGTALTLDSATTISGV